MRKTALFILTMTFSTGAYAAELNTICAANIKADFTGDLPAPSIARVYSGPSGASICETAMAKSLDFREIAFRDIKNQPLRGFEKGYYTEQGPLQVSLVLQTNNEAYYYYEDCDICAEIDKCDLKTGAVSRVVAAHSADCSDLAKFTAGATYSACAKPEPACSAAGEEVRIPEECCSKKAEYDQHENLICMSAAPAVYPSCSAVGEDVRIPDECCSKNAEPNQNGEMTCVEAIPAGSNCSKIGEAVRIPEECCSGNAVPAYGGEMECVEAGKVFPLKSPFFR